MVSWSHWRHDYPGVVNLFRLTLPWTYYFCRPHLTWTSWASVKLSASRTRRILSCLDRRFWKVLRHSLNAWLVLVKQHLENIIFTFFVNASLLALKALPDLLRGVGIAWLMACLPMSSASLPLLQFAMLISSWACRSFSSFLQQYLRLALQSFFIGQWPWRNLPLNQMNDKQCWIWSLKMLQDPL